MIRGNKSYFLAAAIAFPVISCNSPAKSTQPLPGPASADTTTIAFDESRVKITIPNAWAREETNGRHIVLTPDKAVTFVFFTSKFSDFRDAGLHSEDEIAKLVEQPALSEPGKIDILRDQLNAIQEHGTGKYRGQPIQWTSLLVDSAGKPFQLITIAEPKQWENHAADIGRVIMGIEKQ